MTMSYDGVTWGEAQELGTWQGGQALRPQIMFGCGTALERSPLGIAAHFSDPWSLMKLTSDWPKNLKKKRKNKGRAKNFRVVEAGSTMT